MERAPDCLKCRHFAVTWDVNYPRSCTLFGVRTQELPDWEVFKATGRHCPSFELNPRIKSE